MIPRTLDGFRLEPDPLCPIDTHTRYPSAMTFLTAEGNRFKDSLMALVLAMYRFPFFLLALLCEVLRIGRSCIMMCIYALCSLTLVSFEFLTSNIVVPIGFILGTHYFVPDSDTRVLLGYLWMLLVVYRNVTMERDAALLDEVRRLRKLHKRYFKKRRLEKRMKKKQPRAPQKYAHKRPKRKLKYSNQSLCTSLLSMVEQELMGFAGAYKEDIIKEVEALVLLYISVQDSRSWKGVMAAVLSFVKSHYSTSLSSVILQCIDDLFEVDKRDDDMPSDDVYRDQAGNTDEEASWISTLRQMNSNWQLAAQNEGFEKISKLLSILVGAGLLNMASINPTVGGFKLFSDLVVKKHVSSFDIFDALMSTVVYFVEGGYESFKTGSLNPLIYGDHDYRRFDELYLQSVKYADFARPGNLGLLSIDENELEKLYTDTIDLGKKLSKTVKSPYTKKQIQDRIVKLQDLHSTFVQYRQTGGIRIKPYCVGVYGTSSVGKSTIAPLLMVSSLLYNGFRADDEVLIVVNEHDKYMSNYRSSINGVFLDDVGNTKHDFVETSPCVRILEVVNNVKMYANMAELELKGKVSIQPKFVAITTNKKDLCAHTYSNEPASIVRRPNIIVTATVRDQFATNNMLDEKKVYEHYGTTTPDIPDLWLFKVERAYPVPNKTKGKADTIGWKTVWWNGRPLINIDLGTLITFVNLDSKQHYEFQNRLVKDNSNLAEKLQLCSKCLFPQSLCRCNASMEHRVTYTDSPSMPAIPPPSLMRRRGSKDRQGNQGRGGRGGRGYRNQAGEWYERWSSRLTWSDLYARAEVMGESYLGRLAQWTPTSLFEVKAVRYAYAFFYMGNSKMAAYSTVIFTIASSILFGMLFPWSWFPELRKCVLWAFVASGIYIYLWITEYHLLIQTARDTSLGERFHRLDLNTTVKYVLGGSGVLAALYFFMKKSNNRRRVYHDQSIMRPTMSEIEDRDKNDVSGIVARELNYSNAHISSVPVSEKSRTTTAKVLDTLARANQAFLSYRRDGKMIATNVFFLASNIALVPRHFWQSDSMYCSIRRHDPSKTGGNFHAYLSRAESVDIPGTDASLVWIANGGSWKDLREYFPQEYPKEVVPSLFGWKLHDGTLASCKTSLLPGMCKNESFSFMGGHYSLAFKTQAGMCMSPLVADTISPYFSAFHLGGVDDSPKGCGATLLRSEIDTAIASLSERPSVLLSHSEGTMRTDTYGVQFLESATLHPKSPLNELPMRDEQAPNLKIFGSCLGRAKYFTEVTQSCISASIAKVCGVVNSWGGPKFNKGHAWKESLHHSAHPSPGMEGHLLERAVRDYITPFYDILTKYKKLREETKPLTRMEVVCGIDGKRFVDKMPPGTSVGYPLSGLKRYFLTYLDPTEYEGFDCPAELDDMFWVEFERAKQCYLNGERYYPVFKACLKDEPTKLDKDKVRVFQAAPIVLQMLTRMYFLPIARILSLFPELSECAVGINPMGPDWHELSQHMHKFGKDRILAGDYSKYDLRMPAQVMFSAFRILIDIAQFCGYSDEDLLIMRGIATDICYPVMAYNGDLLQHIGSNPSGQNLTVYINSIVNSLLFRCAFYDLYGADFSQSFRSICKLMTYGDDVKGSVKKGYDEFNHLYCASFFEKHDMKFTMPDKTSTPTAFMLDEDADFLKRKNVYNPELDLIMGALDEDAIFKSLHANRKSKILTPQQLAGQNIDGALREWFNHGREMYEMRREQMNTVAEECDIKHMCQLLDSDYDAMLEVWRERYDPEYSDQVGEYELEDYTLEEIVEITEDSLAMVDMDQFALMSNRELVDAVNATLDEDFPSVASLGYYLLHWTHEFDLMHLTRNTTLVMMLFGMWMKEIYQDFVYSARPVVAAAALYCGDEFVPYAVSMYDHCNREINFDFTPIIINLCCLPAVFWFHYAWCSGKIAICPTQFRYYHYFFLFNVINGCGLRWIGHRLLEMFQLHWICWLGCWYVKQITEQRQRQRVRVCAPYHFVQK